MSADDPRLILREEALDASLELLMLAEAALWSTVDAALEAESAKLGRSHWRAAFLIKRRPGLGVRDLAVLTGLTKQAASRTLRDLEQAGMTRVEAREGEDGRRRPAVLTEAGAAFEARISERLRAQIARAYRTGGLDGVAPARRILAALAGPRLAIARREDEA